MWMLDTNICSYILRHRPPEVKRRFDDIGEGGLAISAVVLAELRFGAARHPQGERILRSVEDFSRRLEVLSWDVEAARAYGTLRAHMEKKGSPMGAMDLLIAAHALSQDAVLATNNVRHFDRVPGLRWENWVDSSLNG